MSLLSPLYKKSISTPSFLILNVQQTTLFGTEQNVRFSKVSVIQSMLK